MFSTHYNRRETRKQRADIYGAFDGRRPVGVPSMQPTRHISGFFVDAAYHRRGIGKKLLAAMRRDYEKQVFTVHASPCAVEIYRHLGFVPTDGEQVTHGLRYTPMVFGQE